ncbi:Arylsulfatase [Maioricimonas rarisocia]|uniref:Arylsulfatase n=1 Tax=Maioricimonas rarisocia TaxID=2528026 RepID=A0A517ZEJ7_9PLAN|nr:sulfatase [Maioricimonas rarisocia]QDU40910.1 Arylsulfatase [Maioricimonas rarisocia]
MTLRTLLVQVGVLLTLWISPLGEQTVAGAGPHVLFIAIDDLRPDLGSYGNKQVHSPHLDALSSQGVRFERAYCQYAQCNASRASLLTGLRPDSTRVYDLVTDFRDRVPGAVTLPQMFKRNGYAVLGMGKIFHNERDDPQSWHAYFAADARDDTYMTAENQALVREKFEAALAQGLKGTELVAATRGPATESADVPVSSYHDGQIADAAIAVLEHYRAGTLPDLVQQRGAAEAADARAIADRPLFLALGFRKPHLPFVAPQKFWDLYQRGELPLADNPFPPKDSPPWALTNFDELRNYHDMPKTGPVSPTQARLLRHGYYACVSFVDAQVGRVLKRLDQLGMRDDTIVVVWGDHGWKLGEHASWSKNTNFELDTRSPLIIHAPGVGRAGVATGLVEFVDIYPTLAELCGLTPPWYLQGTSMVPLLENPRRGWKTAAFSQILRRGGGNRTMGYSMRTDEWRYTAWVNPNNRSQVFARELYGHSGAGAENVNVADQVSPLLIKALEAELWAGGTKSLPEGVAPPGRRRSR